MSAKIDPNEFSIALNELQLTQLFVTNLGWDRPELASREILIGESKFTLDVIAQKRGVVIFLCSSDETGKIPPRIVQLKIEKEATKIAYEHLLVFCDEKKTMLTWLWVSRIPGQPTATRTHTWIRGTSTESLRQKLENIVWSLKEEDAISLSTVTAGLKRAFDREKVTKGFYELFREQHMRFSCHIEGIGNHKHREWYASVVLNRLMFIYFIQKKDFLDGDVNYLSNRLEMVRSVAGSNRFHTFYRYFLLRLFHEGLGKQVCDRGHELSELLGDVPYLNGGIFEMHSLEIQNKEIHIPDIAFEELFRFFDTYEWHLDDRPLGTPKEINPDVLGYIFEKYINDREKGAYYTKEDISEFIGRSTIIPQILGHISNLCPAAFEGEDSVWRYLWEDPTRYIYQPLMVGVFDSNNERVPESDLPAQIQDRIIASDIPSFNSNQDIGEAMFYTKTGERGTLPTETWSEYIERRIRCLRIYDRIKACEVRSIEDLISLNLDIRQFIQDIIVHFEDPNLLYAIWVSIAGRMPQDLSGGVHQGITILDPTCGSGAFLFAALKILEPLYEGCIDRMEELIETASPISSLEFKEFSKIIKDVNKHQSRRYYIYKCIVLRNLFGVDIMNEAVEICKLRLFLKMVSQVDYVEHLEPLPDIDFNIRCGNALVGYASVQQFKENSRFLNIERRDRVLDALSRMEVEFIRFREDQLGPGDEPDRNLKQKLNDGLCELRLDLDRIFAEELGLDFTNLADMENWREEQQTFHWLSEFYGVMHDGGFEVVIGNPPYVKLGERFLFEKMGYATSDCPDIYALCMERARMVSSRRSRFGMIVPLNLAFSEAYSSIRSHIYKTYKQNWFSSYANSPSMLFSGTFIRCVIHIASRHGSQAVSFTTRLHRWHAEMRSFLFSTVIYTKYAPQIWKETIPKLNGSSLIRCFERHLQSSYRIGSRFSRVSGKHSLHYKVTCRRWLSFGHIIPLSHDSSGNSIPHSGFSSLYFSDDIVRRIVMCLLNGKIALLYWIATGDEFHVTLGNISSIPFDLTCLSRSDVDELVEISKMLEKRLETSIGFAKMHGKSVGNFNLLQCRDITDKSDAIFSRAFGFDSAWNEIEVLYSHFVKLGVKSM